MNIITKCLLITSVLSIGAIKNVEKSLELTDKSKLSYNMSEDNKLDGSFLLKTPDDKLSLRGTYKNGERSGNWYSFNANGTIFSRYNYDMKKLVMLDTAAIGKVAVDIKTSDKEIKEKASVPIPICSIEQYVSLLGAEFQRRIYQENKNAEGTIYVDLIANIDEKGGVYYSGVYTIAGIKAVKKLTLNEKIFDIDWIPATYNGKTYASVFSVQMKADFSQDPTKRQRFQWNY